MRDATKLQLINESFTAGNETAILFSMCLSLDTIWLYKLNNPQQLWMEIFYFQFCSVDFSSWFQNVGIIFFKLPSFCVHAKQFL